jgi:hypothetical protein
LGRSRLAALPRATYKAWPGATNTEAAILGRIIQPETPGLAPELSRFILGLDFTSADRDRMNDLAVKARAGTLAAEEDEELGNYIHVGHILALMQSKARKSLQHPRAA